MKVLIIGSTSVIGKAVAETLVAQNIDVMMAGRKEADVLFDLSKWQEKPSLEKVFDVVLHVAADFGGATDEDYIRTELVNAVGTLSACALARHVQASHFVLVSSISATYKIGDPYYGIYSLSKRHSEEVALFYCEERFIPLTILRPTQVYDDAGLCRYHQSLFYHVADLAQAGKDIDFFGSHDACRNYLHVKDLCEIVFRVIKNHRLGIFECGFLQNVRLSEMADAAYDAFGTCGKINFILDKPDLVDLQDIKDYKLFELIHYKPVIDIKEGYRRIKKFREEIL